MKDRKQYWKEYSLQNRERIRLQKKEYNLKNREKKRLSALKWNTNNKQHIREHSREKIQALKKEVLSHYCQPDSPNCVMCGENRLPCLTLDHINDDGAKERKELNMYGSNFYLWVKRNRYPERYQVLCWNCQYIKRDKYYLSRLEELKEVKE